MKVILRAHQGTMIIGAVVATVEDMVFDQTFRMHRHGVIEKITIETPTHTLRVTDAEVIGRTVRPLEQVTVRVNPITLAHP